MTCYAKLRINPLHITEQIGRLLTPSHHQLNQGNSFKSFNQKKRQNYTNVKLPPKFMLKPNH